MFIGQVQRTLTVEPVVEPVPEPAPGRAREATGTPAVVHGESPGPDLLAARADEPAPREVPVP